MKEFYKKFKNKTLSSLLFVLFLNYGFGQVANYTFSESNGTYTAITGGAVVATCNGCGTTYDTNAYGITLPSGSEFPYNLATISQVTMVVDGSLVLGTTTGTSATGPLSSGQTANGVVAALGMDLRNTTISGQTWEMRWQDVGAEVVFQWTNASRWSQNTVERFSFQIRINKSTGVINIVYGDMTTIANSTTYQPVVGLRGATNTDYNNRRLTTTAPDATPNWGAPDGTAAGTSNANTCRFTTGSPSCIPTSGLTFTWTPNTATMDWNNLQWLAGPSGGSNTSLTINYGGTATAYAQGYEAGVTNPAGAGTGVSSWIGYSTTNSNPNGTGWTWIPATFSSQQGNNDEFSVALSGLAPGTYYVASRWRLTPGSLYTYGGYNGFWNGTGNNSIQLTVNAPVNATLPYTDSFSSNNYIFINGSQTNKWVYGSATGNPANALYISNDNGTTNAYTNTSATVAHAYRDITIPSGTTNTIFSFDWKANGESCCDYLRVWLVPNTFTPTAGTQITSGSGRIQVGGNLNAVTTWQTYSNTALDVSTFAGSTMRLVFEWYNDSSVGTNPPAAIDNVSLQLPPNDAMDYNNMQWLSSTAASGRTSVTVPYNTNVTAYARGYEAGVTNGAGAGTGVAAWIGYSTADTNPNGAGWTWVAATYNQDYVNDDEFQAVLNLPPGTYYVASRWKLNLGNYTYGGSCADDSQSQCGGTWNGTTNKNIILTVNAPVNATLPYSDDLSTLNFLFTNGSQTNKWAYGSATGNPANAIYISNDSGVTNAYTNTSASVVQAYRDITIPSGSTLATLSFNWLANGESCCDYLRVWMVPTTFTPTAGTQITSGSGRIQVGGNLNAVTTWQTYSNSTLDISTFAGTTMRLVFEWRNDGSAGTNPPVAVDNVQLYIPDPITITPSSATICSGDSVSLTASSTSAYTYSWSPSTGLSATTGATVSANPATTTSYTVTGTLGSVTTTKTVVVTVNPAPTAVDITNVNASICPNAVQTLTATGGVVPGFTTTVNSGTVNLAIPDNILTTGVAQTLAVSGIPTGATITKVDVTLNITHTWDSDLRINLEGPNGQIVNLINQEGSSSDNFTNTVVTSNTGSAAFSTGSAPFTGTFKADLANQTTIGTTPAVTTSTFSDLFSTPNGDWKVRIYDGASGDTGTLVNCSITITYNAQSITWSPTTSLYTDAACTTAYTGGNSTTVYAKLTADVTYTATATIGSCSKTDTVTFTMKTPVSITSATAGASPICAGDTTTLTANGVAGDNATVTWYSATGGTGTNYGTGLTLANAAAGTYYAYVTGDCGTAEATVTVATGATTTWTGTAWNNGAPDATMTAVISANYSGVNADITACSLTVTNNAVATIPTGYDVFLSKGLTVDSGSTFNLSSDSNLVQTTGTTNLNSGSGTVNVYRKTVPLMRLDYVMWGSPVASQNLLSFSPQTVTTRFYNYSTSINNYVAVASPSTTAFADATGYLIRMPNNHPASPPTVWQGKFTGTPHSGNYSATLTNIAAGQRFNAIANPYPSTITISDFVSANSSNITGTLYFWRKTDNTNTTPGYCTWAGGTFTSNNEPGSSTIGSVLEVGQGFIVEATAGGSSVSFTNAMRVGNNSSHLLKTTATDYNRIWLNMTSPANEFSQMAVGYITGATDGVDMFDGKHFNDGTIALNMKIDGVPYVIQGKSLPFADTDVVPLNYKVTNAGNYTIAIDHVDGLFTGGAQDIFIKDNLNNTYTNLNTGSYTFATDAGTFDNRLELVYRNSALSNNNQVVKDIVVFKQNDQIMVEAGNIEINKVEVYDLRGRLVITKKDVNATSTKLQSVAQNQVLIVKVTATDNTIFVKKIMN